MKVWWLMVAFALTAHAQVEILSPREAHARLGKAVVLEARDEREFRKGHLPGAQPIDWREWTREKPGLLNLWFGNPARWGQVPEPDPSLEKRLRALGLSNDVPVVLAGEPRGWGEEGRIAWLLLYLGAERVALLDGGFPAWKKAGLPVEKGRARSPDRGSFKVTPRPERLATLAQVKEAVAAGKRTLLDARSAEEFAGRTVTGQKRGGHLPGAHLVPVSSLYRADGTYVSAEELKKLLPPSVRAPITYCVGGVRSSLLAVLWEARTGSPAANFAGSIWEWAEDPSLPLVQGK